MAEWLTILSSFILPWLMAWLLWQQLSPSSVLHGGNDVPLTKTDQKILDQMRAKHGTNKGTSEFYASATKGVLGKDIQKRHGAQYRGNRNAK